MNNVNRVYPSEDTYIISSYEYYIHSHYRNMKDKMKENHITLDLNGNTRLIDPVRKVIIAILDDVINDWTNYQAEFIRIGQDAGIEGKNSTDFLKNYNKLFQIAQSGITQELLDWKESVIKYQKISKQISKNKKETKLSETKKQELLDIVNVNWQELVNLLIDIANFYKGNRGGFKSKKTTNFLFPNAAEKDQVKGYKYSTMDQISENYIKVLKNFKIEETNITNIIKKLKPFFNGTKTLKIEKQQEIFEQVAKEFASGAGYFIEHTLEENILKTPVLKTISGIEEKKGDRTALTLSKDFVGDILVCSTKINSRKVKMFASIKLTKDVDVMKEYSIQDDILDGTLKNRKGTKHFSTNSEAYKDFLWLRRNMMSLNSFSLDKVNQSDFEKYLNLEQNIALWLLIPRLLDGIFDYTTNQSRVMDKKDKNTIFYTALFFSKGKFYWTLDLLKKIRKVLAGGDIIEVRRLITSWKKYPKINMSGDQAKLLWTQKQEAMKKMNNNINYFNLYNTSSIKFHDFDNIFARGGGTSSPLSKVQTIMKYSTLIQD